MKRRRLRFQNQLLLLVLVAAAPVWLVAMVLLWDSGMGPVFKWTLAAILSVFLVGGALVARSYVVYPLQSLANLLEALREEDYSLRGRNIDAEDALGEVMIEVNSLSHMLHDQRLGTLEAGVLLEKIISEIDIAVFAFDSDKKLKLANRAGAELLRKSSSDLQDQSAGDLDIEFLLHQPSVSIVTHVFPGASGRWEIRRRSFREGGRPHELVVISDLSRALREEERQAWQRLVRVIGHELNSSLTPIKSMAGTLSKLLDREQLPDDWRDDAQSGLSIIHDRSESLGRFMEAYARLARLPMPAKREVEFSGLAKRIASLHGGNITLETSSEAHINADADQIEQVLINLVKNAVEATGENGSVSINWYKEHGVFLIEVRDDGPGLSGSDNLWVPFYTTKPGGTGVGLVLCREIIENHGGEISLENVDQGSGCIARIRLPVIS